MGLLGALIKVSIGSAAGILAVTALPVFGAVGVCGVVCGVSGTVVGSVVGAAVGVADEFQDQD